MDLAAFYASYRDDGWGRAAHDPAMMVALLVHAYAIGERSSRGIERRCGVTSRSGPLPPTSRPITRRSRASGCAMRPQSPACRSGAGVVRARWSGHGRCGGGRRTKVAAAATHHATRTYEQIAKEILKQAARSMRPRTSGSGRIAVTSCRRACGPAAIVARCCARPSRRWRPSSPPRPRRSRAIARRGWSTKRFSGSQR